MLIACQAPENNYLTQFPNIDLLITNGAILDGSGSESELGDIVIVGDEIVFVGKTAFSKKEIRKRVVSHINADGRVIAPGFIDLHSHGDPLETPEFENFLAMGITTITLGQDGDSPAVPMLTDWLAQIESQGIALNLAMFVGHGTLRNLSGIGRQAIPLASDLEHMLTILDETLRYSFGLSTGLEYNPGLNAQTAELHALAKIVGKHDRLIMSHIRNEDDDQIVASIHELIDQGQYAKVHVSHLKSVYGHDDIAAEKILLILDNARNEGVNISADLYPYNASYTGISIVFPVWAKTTAQFDIAKRDRRPELEAFLRKKITRRNGPEATLLGTPPYTGKTLADLSREYEMPFEQVLIDIIGPQGASGAYFVMDDKLQTRLLLDPNISYSSDGRLKGFHPRGHGAFAKIIEEYVNKRQILTLTEAIRKMTSQSASILNISDRGLLKEGYKADILIFEPNNVKAQATYPEPHQLALGFDIVIVNGNIARRNGLLTKNLFGKVLKPI
ncbi:MAG: N-acyl-D-amino-acid deacylase [Candidatus Azotimanducaceae bacterium]|jgi:N-acyl-D-amino-acid deacylase